LQIERQRRSRKAKVIIVRVGTRISAGAAARNALPHFRPSFIVLQLSGQQLRRRTQANGEQGALRRARQRTRSSRELCVDLQPQCVCGAAEAGLHALLR
jgi:hypothetical protein